jgi:sortase (surface protein transpeptidase)
MTEPARPGLNPGLGRRWREARWWVATAVLLLVAALSLTAGLRGDHNALATPLSRQVTPSVPRGAPSTFPSAAPADSSAPAPPVAPVGSVAPVALRIPAIGVAVSLSTLGLNPDQTVEVPTDFAQPGWFRLGPTPGQPGAAVILGHVDSYQGPAVFYRLGALQTGDQVEVVLAGGAVAHFAVTTVATYPKDQFPAQQVYATHGSSALQLVTCGGQFDTRTRSYLANVVAYTTLTAITPG